MIEVKLRALTCGTYHMRSEWRIGFEGIVLCLALCLMFVGATVSFVIVAPIFNDSIKEAMRLELASRVFIFFGSIVTALTVFWRGSIASRQADAQIEATKNQSEQIRLTREQVALTLESNHAKLLKDGLELIKEEDAEMQDAGLAIISTIAASPDRKHATLVMDILADRLIPRLAVEDQIGKASTIALITMLEAAAKAGNRSNRSAQVHHGFFLPYLVPGLRRMIYTTPSFGGIRIPIRNLSKNAQHFYKCTIESCHIAQNKVDYDSGVFFDQTSFILCEFTSIDSEQLNRNNFQNCCFSDAVIWGDADIPDLRKNGNYFDPGHPPRLPSSRKIDWATKLNPGAPNPPVNLRDSPLTAHLFP